MFLEIHRYSGVNSTQNYRSIAEREGGILATTKFFDLTHEGDVKSELEIQVPKFLIDALSDMEVRTWSYNQCSLSIVFPLAVADKVLKYDANIDEVFEYFMPGTQSVDAYRASRIWGQEGGTCL